MNRFFFALTLFGVGLQASAAQANLLDDPGFESATGGGQVSNSNWSLTVDFVDPDAPTDGSAQFQDAPWASNPLGDPGVGVWFKSFKGGGANDPVNAALEQSVATGPGVYDLSFYVRHEENFTADAMDIILSSDQGDLANFDILNDALNDGSYNQYSINDFVASPGTTSLTVRAVMTNGVAADVNPQSLMLDDFSLTRTIPEPSSILLAGLGIAALVGYRRC